MRWGRAVSDGRADTSPSLPVCVTMGERERPVKQYYVVAGDGEKKEVTREGGKAYAASTARFRPVSLAW